VVNNGQEDLKVVRRYSNRSPGLVDSVKVSYVVAPGNIPHSVAERPESARYIGGSGETLSSTSIQKKGASPSD